MIPIRLNGYAERQLLIGFVLGVGVGIITYYFFAKEPPPDSNGFTYHVRENIAICIGLTASFAIAALVDVFQRLLNATKNQQGAAAVVQESSGGAVWYLPMWIVGAIVAVIIFEVGNPFGPH
jgi:hypothetical protein